MYYTTNFKRKKKLNTLLCTPGSKICVNGDKSKKLASHKQKKHH